VEWGGGVGWERGRCRTEEGLEGGVGVYLGSVWRPVQGMRDASAKLATAAVAISNHFNLSG